MSRVLVKSPLAMVSASLAALATGPVIERTMKKAMATLTARAATSRIEIRRTAAPAALAADLPASLAMLF